MLIIPANLLLLFKKIEALRVTHALFSLLPVLRWRGLRDVFSLGTQPQKS